MKSLNLRLRTFAASLLTFVAFHLPAQSVLQHYIDEGLKNNLTLQEKNISLKQAEQSLQIARSYFMPNISLNGDYTTGDGGRSIQFPIGDLLNPVYASLNQLTQSDQFPQIENVEENFFPNNFYDAKVRTSLPIINTDLYVNKKIVGQQVLLKEYEVEVYKRDLILDIKTAYFNYLSSLEAIKIYESALSLVNKNADINESLLKNGKSLPANVLRSKSEVERVRAELNSARASALNARKYFNFLLNRSLDSEIKEEVVFTESIVDDGPASVAEREELNMLRSAIEIQESTVQLYKLSRLPKVSAFIDLGSQSVDWRFNDNSRYYLAGVQVSVPLFQGFRNNIQIKQSRLSAERSSLTLQNTKTQLQVAADIAQSNLMTARQNFVAAEEQVKSARSYYNLIDKGYQQGVNSLIEYLDARNQLTSSELQLNLRKFEMLTAAANLERQTSSFNLSK